MSEPKFYIAINGASCALAPVPFDRPPVTLPRANCLVGFPTAEQARRAQHAALNDPIPEVMRKLQSWMADPVNVYIVNPDPDPPSGPDEKIAWVEEHGAVLMGLPLNAAPFYSATI